MVHMVWYPNLSESRVTSHEHAPYTKRQRQKTRSQKEKQSEKQDRTMAKPNMDDNNNNNNDNNNCNRSPSYFESNHWITSFATSPFFSYDEQCKHKLNCYGGCANANAETAHHCDNNNNTVNVNNPSSSLQEEEDGNNSLALSMHRISRSLSPSFSFFSKNDDDYHAAVCGQLSPFNKSLHHNNNNDNSQQYHHYNYSYNYYQPYYQLSDFTSQTWLTAISDHVHSTHALYAGGAVVLGIIVIHPLVLATAAVYAGGELEVLMND